MRTAPQALVCTAMLLITTATVTGCGSTTTSDSTTSAAVATSANASTTTTQAVDGQHGRPAAGATTPSLPADWPHDVPVPPGTLTGATGSNGRWTAQFLVPGSATDVRQSTADYYRAAGYTAVSDSVLNNGNRQITLVVENRDHSAGETTLVVQVSTT